MVSLVVKETPLPEVAIILLVMHALPLITLTPTASTPNPSQIDSLPTSEEIKTILLFKGSVKCPKQRETRGILILIVSF